MRGSAAEREALARSMRRALERSGDSARQASAAVGCSHSTMSRYLSGLIVPDALALRSFASFAGVEVTELLAPLDGLSRTD